MILMYGLRGMMMIAIMEQRRCQMFSYVTFIKMPPRLWSHIWKYRASCSSRRLTNSTVAYCKEIMADRGKTRCVLEVLLLKHPIKFWAVYTTLLMPRVAWCYILTSDIYELALPLEYRIGSYCWKRRRTKAWLVAGTKTFWQWDDS